MPIMYMWRPPPFLLHPSSGSGAGAAGGGGTAGRVSRRMGIYGLLWWSGRGSGAPQWWHMSHTDMWRPHALHLLVDIVTHWHARLCVCAFVCVCACETPVLSPKAGHFRVRMYTHTRAPSDDHLQMSARARNAVASLQKPPSGPPPLVRAGDDDEPDSPVAAAPFVPKESTWVRLNDGSTLRLYGWLDRVKRAPRPLGPRIVGGPNGALARIREPVVPTSKELEEHNLALLAIREGRGVVVPKTTHQ